MAMDDLRKRLEALNRSPLHDGRDAADPPDPSRKTLADGRLESLVPGEEIATGTGRCYSIGCSVAATWPPGRGIVSRFDRTFESPCTDAIPSTRSELQVAIDAGAERLLFLDIETCGFAGTPVFLIGAMHYDRGDLHVEQLVARSYSEEEAILDRFRCLLEKRPHLVTFNGKSFDWPFLLDRAAIWRVPIGRPSGHCDLLHAARRRYRDVLPNCRLQTLESMVCGRRRRGDIPGAEIPAAYHAFVAGGDAHQMREILQHNFLDLATLAEVLARLARE